MKLRKEAALGVGALLVGLILNGCGGSSSGGTSQSDSTLVFAQDDMNTGYSHVWVTIDSVSLTNKGGSPVTVFDDTSGGGKTVDLLTLHGVGAPLFMLLGQAPPGGSYTGASVVVSSTLSVVPTGSNSAVGATFAGSTGSTYTMNLAFPNSVGSGPHATDEVIDFNLKNWTLNGTVVSAPNNAYLSVGSSGGLANGGQHVSTNFGGQVQGLSGTVPNQTFTLGQGPMQLTVQTNASTVIENFNGAQDPAVADGEFAFVAGTFNPSTDTFEASSVRLGPGASSVSGPSVSGLVSADSQSAGTLTVSVLGATDWLPNETNVTVSIGSTTALVDGSGVTVDQATFFSDITTGTTHIDAQGTLSSGVLQATSVRIDNSSIQVPNEVAFAGSAANIDTAAGTFDLQIAHWEGLRPGAAQVVHVTTSGSTQYLNGGSNASFFASLASGTNVMAVGEFNVSTDTLSALHLMNAGSGGGLFPF